jgi:hypothetical protein
MLYELKKLICTINVLIKILIDYFQKYTLKRRRRTTTTTTKIWNNINYNLVVVIKNELLTKITTTITTNSFNYY